VTEVALPRLPQRTLHGTARAAAPEIAAVLLVAAVLWVLRTTATIPSIRDTLIFMGFDTERAMLIVALLMGLAAGTIAGAVGTGRLPAAILGIGATAATYAHTFIAQTTRDTTASANLGRLDPGGWLTTFLAIVAAGGLAGLAAGILASEARSAVADLAGQVRAAYRTRRPAAIHRARLAVVVTVVAAVLVAVPSMGAMLNYSADVLMRNGGQNVPLVPSGAGMVGIPGMGGQSTKPPTGRSSSPGTSGWSHGAPQGVALPPVTTTSGSRPWLAWRPSGSGQVLYVKLPAPWSAGTSPTANVAVYLPPGYGIGNRRYPVVYEAPWPITLFQNGANIQGTLDALITSGTIPASIFVFASSGGGPYVDNECINSADGRENFDDYLSRTLISYVDQNYRTIADRRARSLMGDSQGGYCAADLLVRHPDVFGQEITWSGYFMAAPLISISPSAVAPFGGNLALMRAYSPMLLTPRIPQALRGQLYFVIIGLPTQPIYGPQIQAFTAQLRYLGYPYTVISTPFGHSWNGVRDTLPAALMAIAAQEVRTGVFAH